MSIAKIFRFLAKRTIDIMLIAIIGYVGMFIFLKNATAAEYSYSYQDLVKPDTGGEQAVAVECAQQVWPDVVSNNLNPCKTRDNKAGRISWYRQPQNQITEKSFYYIFAPDELDQLLDLQQGDTITYFGFNLSCAGTDVSESMQLSVYASINSSSKTYSLGSLTCQGSEIQHYTLSTNLNYQLQQNDSLYITLYGLPIEDTGQGGSYLIPIDYVSFLTSSQPIQNYGDMTFNIDQTETQGDYDYLSVSGNTYADSGQNTHYCKVDIYQKYTTTQYLFFTQDHNDHVATINLYSHGDRSNLTNSVESDITNIPYSYYGAGYSINDTEWTANIKIPHKDNYEIQTKQICYSGTIGLNEFGQIDQGIIKTNIEDLQNDYTSLSCSTFDLFCHLVNFYSESNKIATPYIIENLTNFQTQFQNLPPFKYLFILYSVDWSDVDPDNTEYTFPITINNPFNQQNITANPIYTSEVLQPLSTIKPVLSLLIFIGFIIYLVKIPDRLL
jgi:hypothetical protein